MRKIERKTVCMCVYIAFGKIFICAFFPFFFLASVWLSFELVGLELMSTFGHAHSMHF